MHCALRPIRQHLAAAEAMEEATEEGVTATEEAAVTLSAVIEGVIISPVMPLAGTVLLDDALLPTVAMAGLVTMLPGMALGDMALSPA